MHLTTGEQSVVFVEEPDGSSIGILEAPEELTALMERLNQNGLREKALYDALAKRHDHIAGSLGYHLVNLDIYQAPRWATHGSASRLDTCDTLTYWRKLSCSGLHRV